MQSRWLLILAALLVGACSSVKSSFDFDRGADFTQYKTFGFTQEALALPVNDLVRRRLVASITKTMETKGFTAASNTPDLLIDLGTQTREEERTNATSATIGGFYGRRWAFSSGMSSTQFTTTKYTVGTLIISLVDASKNQLVWEGKGSSTITDNSLQEDRLEAAITQILQPFPPPVKK